MKEKELYLIVDEELGKNPSIKIIFNRKYNLLEHLIEFRSMRGYYRIDHVEDKESRKPMLVLRVVDFKNGRAVMFEKDLG